MFDSPLSQAIERFAVLTYPLSAPDLERPWKWKEYDEGVRFSFFRAYEMLRELAVRVAGERQSAGSPQTPAQHILAQYHRAHRDLDAALLGIDSEIIEQPPAENEWPVRRAVAHMVQAEIGFYVGNRFGLDTFRSGGQPVAIPDEAWERLIGLSEERVGAVLKGPFEPLRLFQKEWHARVVAEFAGVTGAELESRSYYWESEPMPLRFRLHRFDSHLRQHTVQVDKTLAAVRGEPGEARRLLRQIYQALGEAEGEFIGAGDLGQGLQAETAAQLSELTGEIEAVLSSPDIQ